MNMVFVSFQGVHSNGRAWGMVRIMEPIVDVMRIPTKYVVSHAPYKYKYFEPITIIHHYISRFIWSIGIRLKVNIGLLRYLQEKSFELFLLRKMKYPCILVSTAIIPLAAKMNREAGGINIYIAGNPYDRYISKILDSESIKYGVKIRNAYTHQSRLKFIDKFLYLQNAIISQSILTHESFFNNFDGAIKKLSKYEMIPDRGLFKKDDFKKNTNFTFVYVASTVWLKGLTYLIDAWNLLSVTDAKLVIAGPIYNDVWHAIKGKIPNSVQCIGFVPAVDLNKIYRESHVCIVPSLVDNHPATIAEAMYCELPVIATLGCGSRSLILEGETGFVVPVGDAEALAQKINWFLQNRELVKEMGLKARTTIDSLDQQCQASAMVSVIKSLSVMNNS